MTDQVNSNKQVLDIINSWLTDKEGWNKINRPADWTKGYKKALYDISGLISEISKNKGISTDQVQSYSSIDKVVSQGIDDTDSSNDETIASASEPTAESTSVSGRSIEALLNLLSRSDDDEGDEDETEGTTASLEDDAISNPELYAKKVESIRRSSVDYYDNLEQCSTPVSITLYWHDGKSDTIIIRIINELLIPGNKLLTSSGIDQWINFSDNRIEDVAGSTYWISPDKIKQVKFNHIVSDSTELSSYMGMQVSE